MKFNRWNIPALLHLKHLFFIIALLSSCLSSITYAQNVFEYTLINGLKLIVKPDQRSSIVVSQIWYKVGSSYEHNGISGISHALEHMMFRGTKRFPPGRFSQLITENGGVENAFTNYDYTAYFQILPAEKLELGFKLEADRMNGLLLSTRAFAKEIKTVIEERRLRVEDVPQSLTEERFLAAAYVSSPYHHPVIGWMSDLKNMSAQNLKDWYDKWYTPSNAVVVVVGDVKPEEVYLLAERYFSKIRIKTVPSLKPRKEIKPLGRREITVKTPAKLPWLAMGYQVPSLPSIKDKNRKPAYALMLLTNILSMGESARLEKELVRQKQLATSISAHYDKYQRQTGLLTIYSSPAQGKTIIQLKQAILKQIEKLQKELVDERELDRVKTLAIAHNTYKKDSMFAQAMEIGVLESVGLSWKTIKDYVKNIQSVTPEDIREAARNYLTNDRLTVATLDPLPISKIQKSPGSTYEKIIHIR